MQRKLFRPLAAVALLALAAGAAQARDNVFWSVGIDAAPGVSLGVSNTRPVMVAPQPVYVAPQPVYVAPQPVYVAPRPVVVRPRPVLLVAEPVYVRPGKHKGWHKHKHRRHGRHDD
jgi:hypothetical protein